MDVINSLKKLFFNEKDIKNQIIINKNKKEIQNSKDYYSFNYYKYIFKRNYKMKNNLNNINDRNNFIHINFFNLEKTCELKIKVNKCSKHENKIINKNKKIFKKTTLNPINKNKLQLKEINKNNVNFFYILKGAVLIIEDWWKNILKKNYIKKQNDFYKKRFNFNNNNDNEFINKNKNSYKSDYIINLDKNIYNKKIRIFPYNKNNNRFFKSNNSLNLHLRNKINENERNEKEENQKESYLEDTVINFDSGFLEFTDNKKKENEIKKEKEKINKIIRFDEEIKKRKIYSFDRINNNKINNINEKENIETKRENSIIYPMNEIEHLVIEDICSNLDKHLKNKIEKEKKIINYYNLKKNKKVKYKNKDENICSNINIINNFQENENKKQIDTNKINIPWEDPNNNMTPFISIEQNNELFNEIKSKIKVNLKKINDENESEISIIQNKYLLRENPLNDSSIYIKNSDIRQNELIRNVNIHIVPTKVKEVSNINNFKNRILNNSNNSITIHLEDEDYGFSDLIDISDSKNDGHTSSFFNSIYKSEEIEKDKGKKESEKNSKKDIIVNKQSKKRFENIYKN